MRCRSRALLSSMMHSLAVALVLATANLCCPAVRSRRSVAIRASRSRWLGSGQDVEARFGVPANGRQISSGVDLHGSGGWTVAAPLCQGFAGGRYRHARIDVPARRPTASGRQATMPFAAAALVARDASAVDSARLGVMDSRGAPA
jgi:hypothetical protein